MKKENFVKKLEKIMQNDENYWYDKCETSQEKANFRQSYKSPLDTIVVHFYPTKNRVFLYDLDKNYRERKSMIPTEALKQIKEWSDCRINDDIFEVEEQRLLDEENDRFYNIC